MCDFSSEKSLKFDGTCWLRFIFFIHMGACVLFIPFIVYLRQEGYEFSDQIESVVSIKVYGTVKSDFSHDEFKDYISPAEREMYNRVWDPADYVLPHVQGVPSEVFIVTNLVIRQNQTRSVCPEDPDVKNAVCDPSDPNHCHQHIGSYNGSGIATGKCVWMRRNNGTFCHSCEVEAWCPVIKHEDLPLKNNEAVLKGVNESMVIIATSLHFPQFNYTPLPEVQFRNYKTCDSDDYHCPPWKLGDIISSAGVSKPEEEVYKYGAVLALHIHWDDCTVGRECNPMYMPTDFENPDMETYQYHTYVYKEVSVPDLKQRTLVKAYGVRLIVLASGTAKRWTVFSFVTSCIKYGSILSAANALFAFCVLSVCYRSYNWQKCSLGSEKDPYSEVREKNINQPKIICNCLCTAMIGLKECITCQCRRRMTRINSVQSVEMPSSSDGSPT